MKMPNYFMFAFAGMRKNKQEMEKLVKKLFTLEIIAFWRIRMTCAFIVAKKVI